MRKIVCLNLYILFRLAHADLTRQRFKNVAKPAAAMISIIWLLLSFSILLALALLPVSAFLLGMAVGFDIDQLAGLGWSFWAAGEHLVFAVFRSLVQSNRIVGEGKR